MSAPVICDCGRAVIPAGSVVCVKGGINHRRGLCVDRVTRAVQPSSSALPGPTLAEGLPHLLANVEDQAPECRACRGAGRRIHGWAICPATCQDCGGSGFAPAAAESARALHECEVAS